MAIQIQQLRQVVALAEHGSFVRTAAALHISQPALSRSIRNAEQSFGSELFVRAASGVVPTDLGRVYIERARDLLRMADDLDGEAVARGRLRTGRVVVGGGPYPVEAVLGPAVARFITEHPGVQVRLDTGSWDDLVRRLRGRELDFFVAETSLLTREPDIEVVTMPAPRPIYWVCRTGHPLAQREEVRTPDIFEFPFVTPARVPPRVLAPLLQSHAEGSARLRTPLPIPTVQCDSLAAAKRIVASSDGITASILSCIANELESGRVVLLGTEPWLYVQYGIVSLKRRPWTQAAATLRDVAFEIERAVATEEHALLHRYGPRFVVPRRRTARVARRRSG
jgi:DNA-binding transcriptional LysR family regulator